MVNSEFLHNSMQKLNGQTPSLLSGEDILVNFFPQKRCKGVLFKPEKVTTWQVFEIPAVENILRFEKD